MLHGVVRVSVVAVLEAMVRSCPAPDPVVILAVAPLYRFSSMFSVLFPTVVAANMSTCSGGCNSNRQ
jgi:hypothetical protein